MSNTSFYREELTGHRRRLEAIRPRIDSTTPSSYFVLINRAKKDQLLSDWAHNVDTANLALLSRMTAIANQHTLDDHRAVTEERERRHREQSDADRRREQKRIEEENARMIERLQAQKSNYGASNWRSHAAAYEKHIKEVRLRQMLIADPIGAKKKIAEEKEKARAARQAKKARKLKPLDGAAGGDGSEMSYDRDETADMEEKEAAEAEEEEQRRAGVEVGAFDEVDADELLAADKARAAGSVSLSEWMMPRNANHTPLHQDSHTIDSHLVLLTVDEVNRSTARSVVPLGDDWSAFTTHPPAFLHSYLLRSYDLDSGLHSHLYMPVQAMLVLGKGVERRLESIIELLGYTTEGELFFKQSLMPKQPKAKEDKRSAALYAGRRERAAERQPEKKVEEKQPAPVKAVKRAEKKQPKPSRPPVEETKEQMEAPAAEAETEYTTESEQPAVDQADDAANTDEQQAQAEQQVEPEAEQQQEEEENYAEESEQRQQQEQEEQAEANVPATVAEEAEQSPQPTAAEPPVEKAQAETAAPSEPEVSQQQEQPAEAEPKEASVKKNETAEEPSPSAQTETETQPETEAEPEQTKADVAQAAEPAAAEPAADESEWADNTAGDNSATQPEQQPAAVQTSSATDSKPAEEEKQAEENEYPDDTQTEGEPQAESTSPVPTFHKELTAPPPAIVASEPQQQPTVDIPATPKAAEEEKEFAPAASTPINKPVSSPSVSQKGEAHQHRSVGTPISSSKRIVATE